MSSENILLNPLIQVLIIFGASLLAALLLYGVLKSTGIFKRKGMQLGGAAAGFIIIFIVASQTLARIEARRYKEEMPEEVKLLKEVIRERDEEIEGLKRGELPGIEHPPGFEVQVSRFDGIAYAYPKDWPPPPDRIVARYNSLGSVENGKLNLVQASIVIAVEPINPEVSGKLNKGEITERDILDINAAGIVKTFKGYNEETSVFMVDNCQGLKVTFDYENAITGIDVSVEQVTVLDRNRNRFFAFTLTALPEHIDESRETFYSVLHTVKFLD